MLIGFWLNPPPPHHPTPTPTPWQSQNHIYKPQPALHCAPPTPPPPHFFSFGNPRITFINHNNQPYLGHSPPPPPNLLSLGNPRITFINHNNQPYIQPPPPIPPWTALFCCCGWRWRSGRCCVTGHQAADEQHCVPGRFGRWTCAVRQSQGPHPPRRPFLEHLHLLSVLRLLQLSAGKWVSTC